MELAFLWLFSCMAGLGGKVFTKLCSNMVVGNAKSGYSLFLAINGSVACLFFWITGGFRVQLNAATAVYSFAYALIVALMLIVNLTIYHYVKIVTVNVISGTCNLIGTSLLGALLFQERVTLLTLLRLGIMTVAVFLSFLDNKQKHEDLSHPSPKGNWYRILPLMLLMIVTGCSNTLITKAYAQSAFVTDENSFFFFTNVFLAMGGALVYLIEGLRHPDGLSTSLEIFKPRKLVCLVGNTVCSNVGSLINIWLVARMAVSIYTPISSALGMITGVVASLLFREKLGIFAYLAAAIACIAAIL